MWVSVCSLAVLGSQGIVAKCTSAIFSRTVDSVRHLNYLHEHLERCQQNFYLIIFNIRSARVSYGNAHSGITMIQIKET